VNVVGRGKRVFRESDVTRAIRAAAKAGVSVARVEIEDGKITVIIGKAAETVTEGNNANPWDEVLKHEQH
jgi:hypothetical protein